MVNWQIVANFTDVNPTAATPFTGTLTNSALLLSRAGCQAATNAIGGGSIFDGCGTLTSIPNSQIPLACMDPTAVDLLQFVPSAPNNSF